MKFTKAQKKLSRRLASYANVDDDLKRKGAFHKPGSMNPRKQG